MRRLQSFFLATLLTITASSSAVSLSWAAQQAPSGLKITCSAPDYSTKSVSCGLEVAAETIGAEIDLSIPKNPVSQVANLIKGTNTSLSSAFFKLEQEDRSNDILIQADFADLTTEVTHTEPFAAISFKLVFSSLQASDLPIVITAQFKDGSNLHTPTSLDSNQAAFLATEDIPLEIRIDGTGEPAPEPTETTGGIDSSFSFGGSGGGPNFLKQAPVFYCFDDPIDSMTDEEWAIICEAKKRGIVSGNPRDDGTYFFPNQPINRAEAVKIVTLGILRSLGYLADKDFSNEETTIRSKFPAEKIIGYPDIKYEANGEPPWFAVYVNIATREEIVHGYPHDGTYKAVNKINNAESYRVIVETGRIAHKDIASKLKENERKYRLTQDWFMKYSDTLKDFKVDRSTEYAKFTTRKDFLIYVMELLFSVGL